MQSLEFVSWFVCLLVSRISEKLLRKFSQYVHIIHGSVPFENGDIVAVRLLLRKEKPIFAHTFQWPAALKWAAARANTSLPRSSLLP